jgi:hypothetical protein
MAEGDHGALPEKRGALVVRSRPTILESVNREV